MGWIEMIVQGVGKRASDGFSYASAKDKLWADANRAASTLEKNAQVAEGLASDAEQRGSQEAGQVRSAAAKLTAEQEVAAAASGVNPNSGSVVSTIAGSRQLAELDARTTETNAARAAWGFKEKASQLRDQIKQVRQDASANSTSLDMGFVISMLTPGSGVGSAIEQSANSASTKAPDATKIDSSAAAALNTGELKSTARTSEDEWVGYDSRSFYEYDLQNRPRIKRG